MEINSLPEENNVSIASKAVLNKLQENIGWLPNLYKALAFSLDALHRYFTFQKPPGKHG